MDWQDKIAATLDTEWPGWVCEMSSQMTLAEYARAATPEARIRARAHMRDRAIAAFIEPIVRAAINSGVVVSTE